MKNEEKINMNNNSNKKDNKNIISIYINIINKNLHSSKQEIIYLKKLIIFKNKTENSLDQ